MLSALEAASDGPHARVMRDQHAYLVGGRARTRSTISQLGAELDAQRTLRLHATCEPRRATPARDRLVDAQSTRNARSSCRARPATYVARAIEDNRSDGPGPRATWAHGTPVDRTKCPVSGNKRQDRSDTSATDWDRERSLISVHRDDDSHPRPSWTALLSTEQVADLLHFRARAVCGKRYVAASAPAGSGARNVHLFTMAEIERFIRARAERKASYHSRQHRQTPGRDEICDENEGTSSLSGVEKLGKQRFKIDGEAIDPRTGKRDIETARTNL